MEESGRKWKRLEESGKGGIDWNFSLLPLFLAASLEIPGRLATGLSAPGPSAK